MTDIYQILLTIVITTLTLILTAIGVQIFLILIEVRRILKKTDSMFEDASRVTHAVVEPVEEASTFLTGLKGGLGMIKSIKQIFTSGEG